MDTPKTSGNPTGPQPEAESASTRRVTLRDIANVIGVTPTTVSSALRNQPRISTAMRDKIQAMAAQMGYQPDPALSALVHYRHNRLETPVRAALAWLNFWPDPLKWRQYREFTSYWEGAEAAAKRMGFHLEEFIVNAEMTPKRLAQILYTRNVRGILIPPGAYPKEWTDEFPWSQFSVVSIGRNVLPLHTITSDQISNTMFALDMMEARGYRRVGFAGEPWISRLFAPGFWWAQHLSSIPNECRVPPLIESYNDMGVYKERLLAWIAEHKPDAILTDNRHIPGMLKEAGLRVPEDIALASFTILDCPIDSGINQNPTEIGRVAVLMLQSLINDNDRGIPAISRQILIKGDWVDGTSLPGMR